MMARHQHWDDVYGARTEDELTWFEETPSASLELVLRYLKAGEPFIDIGAGASRLVDALLNHGFGPLSVLDLSEAALSISRARLGHRAEQVDWIVADITEWEPHRDYSVWHDRAVFHFLTKAEDRAAYVRALSKALKPGGTAIIATFAEDGPEKCSGLPVERYSPESLAGEINRLLPAHFDLVDAQDHVHRTPKGNEQRFQYSIFEKIRP